MIHRLPAVAALVGLLPSLAFSATATLYKSSACGCCATYFAHVERNGYPVDVEHRTCLNNVKHRRDVAPRLASCHTMVLGGYKFEEHVRVDAVDRACERARIRGLMVRGMPAGSPGMGGTLRPSLRVLTLVGKAHATYFSLPGWPPTP